MLYIYIYMLRNLSKSLKGVCVQLLLLRMKQCGNTKYSYVIGVQDGCQIGGAHRRMGLIRYSLQYNHSPRDLQLALRLHRRLLFGRAQGKLRALVVQSPIRHAWWWSSASSDFVAGEVNRDFWTCGCGSFSGSEQDVVIGSALAANRLGRAAVNLDAQISWQARNLWTLKCRFRRRALWTLKCRFQSRRSTL